MVNFTLRGKNYEKKSFLCAGFLLLLSFSVFAEEHLKEAMEYANAAAVHGEAGETAILIEQAKTALEQVLEASIVAKGVAKYHLDYAAKELQESIELANLGHIGSATLHAEAAVKHINISNKYIHPSVIIIKPKSASFFGKNQSNLTPLIVSVRQGCTCFTSALKNGGLE